MPSSSLPVFPPDTGVPADWEIARSSVAMSALLRRTTRYCVSSRYFQTTRQLASRRSISSALQSVTPGAESQALSLPARSVRPSVSVGEMLPSSGLEECERLAIRKPPISMANARVRDTARISARRRTACLFPARYGVMQLWIRASSSSPMASRRWEADVIFSCFIADPLLPVPISALPAGGTAWF